MITKELCEALGLTKIRPVLFEHIETGRWVCVDIKIKGQIVLVHTGPKPNLRYWLALAKLPESCDENLILTQLKLAMD